MYRRYASLFFVMCVDRQENQLYVLEVIHHFVECLDRHFENVCELDLVFNFQKAYHLLDEVLLAGELQETSKGSVLRAVHAADMLEVAAKLG